MMGEARLTMVVEGKTAGPVELLLLEGLRRATMAAVRAAWLPEEAVTGASGGPARRAMVEALERLPMAGIIVAGTGQRGDVAALFAGQRLGPQDGPLIFDYVVDPMEGATNTVEGQTNALAAVAAVPRGALFDPGPALYMEKLVVPPVARGLVDPGQSVPDRISALAGALGRAREDLVVYVLDRPRNGRLIDELRGEGVRLALYPAGDLAGAILAGQPDSGIDALMGTGGVTEGLLAACAVRAMGGGFFARLDPQLRTEALTLQRAGFDTDQWHGLDELVRSPTALFSATGLSTGRLLEGPGRIGTALCLHSLIACGTTGEWATVTSHVPVQMV